MDIDYQKPSVYHQSDYRTSSYRAHSYKQPIDRNFIPSSAHKLCVELKNSIPDYRPKSETTREFQWKINSKRNFREEFAAPIERVRYIHQFTDKIKADKIVKSLNLYKSRAGDVVAFSDLPRQVKFPTAVLPPPIQYACRETFTTNTPGYYPYLDHSVSTTDFDFHRHKDYKTAKTNLIVQKELPFNSKVAYFTPSTKLITENPLRRKYDAVHLRDVSKFPTKTYDRITLLRTKCRATKSETSTSY